MRRIVASIALLAVAGCGESPLPTSSDLAPAALSRAAQAGGEVKLAAVYNTQLRPENEVPASSSEARGHAQIKIYDNGLIEWKIKIHNPANEVFTAGHIHEAPAGAAGKVVLGLFSGSRSDKNIDIRGSATNAELAAEILADPADYYVNFHTLTNRPGAIRGQLD